MSNIILEYAANLYDSVIGVWFITRLGGKRLRDNKLSYLTILIFFIATNLFTHFAPSSALPQCLVHLAIHYIYIFLFSKDKDRRIVYIISPVIFQVALATLNLSVFFLINTIFSIPVDVLVLQSTVYRYLLIFVTKVILTSVLVIIVKLLSVGEERFTLLDLVGYLIFPAVTLFNIELYWQIALKYDMSGYLVYIVISIAALAVLNVLIFVLFRRALQNTSAKHELELLNSRSELEEKRYSEIGNMYQQLQITRHDLKDHLVYIDSLIAQKRYDEVEKYISDRRSELDFTRSVRHTGNRVLDYIINSKLENAKDISFIITGELRELKGIDDLDMASLFGNILDNAIEGTKGSVDPSITLDFSVTGNYQNILCRNTIPVSVLKDNPKLHTTKKENRHRHGYGVKSIRRIVANHNGMIEFYEEDGFFCVHIALNC